MPALRTRDTQSRTLEVSTEAPQLPTLNIVSPTPRAFTFPVTHNLSDSPYSSPSHSPFEPDLRSLSSQNTLSTFTSSSTFTPPPHLTRTLTPETPSQTSSPSSPTNLKRRKSSSSSEIAEHRPKKGDEDYVKRPENAFILFRRKCCEDRQAAQDEAAALDGPAKKQRQADLSKTISQQWKSLSNEERKYWEELAKNKKAEHEKKYPNYVYRPQRAKDKDGKTKNNKKTKRFEFDDSNTVSFIVPIPRVHARSNSAPTPPPYQSIQIPSIYQMTPSCPTSPSLLPMISRRSAFPGHGENVVSSFDYIADTSYALPSYASSGHTQFESSLQSSEFLRSMFSTTTTMQQRNNSISPLDQIALPAPETLLPPHPIISPASSTGSGSSGPSSPLSGPYTPTSTLVSQDYTHLAPDASLEAQAQAEMDLQLEMQMQQEFANFTWGNNGNSIWSSESSILMGDDFDINAIRPVEFALPKFADSNLVAPNHSGLEFGQDFVHTLDGSFTDDNRNLGLLSFDEMITGQSF